MTEVQEFKKPNRLQISITLVVLALGCFLEGASDWIHSLNPPSLTFGAIALDTAGIFLVGLIIGIPVAMLSWNKLVAPIFGVPKIRYVHGLILVTAIYWITGL